MTTEPQRRGRSKLRFECLNAFVDRGIAEAELTPSGIAIWLVLYRHARPDGTTEATVETIGTSTGLCRRTILRGLRELKGAGMLKTIRRGGIGRGASKYVMRPYPPSK